MTTHRHRIIWKRQHVGFIEDPKQWPVLWRGRWLPVEDTPTQEFLAALERGRFLWVVVETEGGEELFATIETLPAEEIELRLSVDEQDTIPLNSPDDLPDPGPAKAEP